MAIPFILHRHVSKKAQKQPYTAAAHVRYISRQSATVYRYAERMPVNWHAAQRFLNEREDRIRKDGRVIDKLTIALPREMSMDQAVDTLRKFGFQLTEGRAPFYFTIQNWGEQNPHCHFILVDADIETGKRVFKTTDLGSTDRIKALWESVCNEELQALGIDASISFDEAALKKAERLEAEAIAENQAPADHVHDDRQMVEPAPPHAPSNELEAEPEEPIPAENETDAEDAPQGDESMALNTKLDLARRQTTELRTMRNKRAEAARLRTEYAYWSGEAVSARQKAEMANHALVDAQSRTLVAERNFKDTHFMGFRRGLNFKLGPFQFKTDGYEKAVQAEAEHLKAAYSEAIRGHDFREAENYANRATQKVWELEQRVASLEQHITMHERINGEENDFDQAEVYFKETIAQLLKGLSPNNIMDAYERDELTIEEAKDLLQQMGHPELVSWIEAQQEEQGQKL